MAAKLQLEYGITCFCTASNQGETAIHIPEDAWSLPLLPGSKWDPRHPNRTIEVDCGDGLATLTRREAHLRGYFPRKEEKKNK